MKVKQSKKIPTNTITYLLVYAGVILVLIVIGLYPSNKSLSNQDMEIQKLEGQIEEQKMLYPLYQDLLGKLQSERPQLLPFPTEGKLPRDKIDKVPSVFSEIAKQSGLKALAVSPDLHSITSDSDTLLFNATLTGGFFEFRNYLIGLAKIPYLSHIEQIQITHIHGSRKFTLKLWLTLEV